MAAKQRSYPLTNHAAIAGEKYVSAEAKAKPISPLMGWWW
jgi:hypothetical protein